jgi:methionyl-tRNA formyltransferase
MRFAIATVDRYQDVWNAFLQAGWQPLKLFTVPLDNLVHHNQAVIKRARDLGIPVQMSPVTTHDLQELQRQGCDALVVASYDWRIPEWQDYLRYAFNFHPSPLPIGRGPYPLHQVILENRSEWGISCHKLSAEFDSGDILAQRIFPLQDSDCHDSLALRLQMAAGSLAQQVAADLPGLWEQAKPQTQAPYWPKLPEQAWRLDFSANVETVLRRASAFGSLECLAEINGNQIYVRRIVGWRETHSLAPGTIAYGNTRSIVVAVADGYVGIVEWSLIARSQAGQIGRG